MTEITRTEQQNAIVDAARGSTASLMVTAYAGCAKTTTLEMLARELPASSVLALAFNVKIKKELEKRLPKHFDVKTLNGLGHTAWGGAIGRSLKLDERKLGRLVTDALKTTGLDRHKTAWGDVRALVTAAMNAGVVPAEFRHYPGVTPDTDDNWELLAIENAIGHTDRIIAAARAVLAANIKEAFAGTISFDDQIYMSALFRGKFPTYHTVLVDEAQDLSPLNHRQVTLLGAKRLVVVGDPKQAIYGFRGAHENSMEQLRGLRPEWIDLPLSVTFRCPKCIVERQQNHAPGFTAAPGNSVGLVRTLCNSEDVWYWSDVPTQGTKAVLCRNNAPLLKMAFMMIRAGIGPIYVGRDIGAGLVALAKRIIPASAHNAAEIANAIDFWETAETSKLVEKGAEDRLAAITDRAECLRIVVEASKTSSVEDVVLALENLFSRDTGQVFLSTGHRAKGLEWDHVLFLDPWRVPSQSAKKAYQLGNEKPMGQELNLRYVIETRARQTLLLGNMTGFAGWQR